MAGADILQFPQALAQKSVLPVLDLAGHRASDLAELELVNRLHRYLDIQTLLEQYLAEIGAWLPIAGLSYTTPDTGESFLAGRATRQVLRSRMQFGGEVIGEIELQVSGEMKSALGAVLAPLAAPLANALLHHRVRLLARKDPLTGLGNRMALETALATEVARAQRFGHTFTMLVVDIDHFKKINDTLGHSSGDQVIRSVAAELAECLRPYDQAFRYGGEEFVVLLSQTGIAKGMQIAERIRRRIAARCRPESDPSRRITASIGAGEFLPSETVSELFDRADRALYRAKSEGRNRAIAAD